MEDRREGRTLETNGPTSPGNYALGYTRFAYSYARSAEDAYAKECRNYDAFGGSHGLDNETQPVSASAMEN